MYHINTTTHDVSKAKCFHLLVKAVCFRNVVSWVVYSMTIYKFKHISMTFRRNYVIQRQPYPSPTNITLPPFVCPIKPLLWKRTTHIVHLPSINTHGVPFWVPFFHLKLLQHLTCPYCYISTTQGHCSCRVVFYLDPFCWVTSSNNGIWSFRESSRTHQKEKWTVNKKYLLPRVTGCQIFWSWQRMSTRVFSLIS